MPALPVGEIVRILIGLFFVDLVRWLWRGEPGPEPATYDTMCAWCGLVYIGYERPATETTPPPRWIRCDPARGLGEMVWWCSLRCHVEHWRADPRADPPAVAEALASWPEVWPEIDDD